MAKRFHQGLLPLSPRLPEQFQPAPFQSGKKFPYLADVLFRWRKTGRTLEQDQAGTQGLGASTRHVPGVIHHRGVLKRPALLQFVGRQFNFEATKSGAFRLVRDELPGFQGKFEPGRHHGAPFLKRGNLWRLVKGLLYLDNVKRLRIFDFINRKSATTHLEI